MDERVEVWQSTIILAFGKVTLSRMVFTADVVAVVDIHRLCCSVSLCSCFRLIVYSSEFLHILGLYLREECCITGIVLKEV